MRKLPLFLLIGLSMMSACKSTKNAGGSATIENINWKLVEIMGNPVTNPGKSGKEMVLRLDKATKRASVYAGCNNFTGGYELMEGNRLKFAKMASTLMACPDMTLETKMKQVLEMTDNYAILDGKLSLNKARMAPLARFEASRVK